MTSVGLDESQMRSLLLTSKNKTFVVPDTSVVSPVVLPIVPVVALALQRKTDLRFLLARRGPGQSGEGEWEFPGGKIEQIGGGLYETQQQALVREIQEELSLFLSENQLSFVADHRVDYEEKTIQLFLWRAQVEHTPEFILVDHDAVVWANFDEMKNMSISRGDRPLLSFL